MSKCVYLILCLLLVLLTVCTPAEIASPPEDAAALLELGKDPGLGLHVLACQVRPEVIFEEFLAAAQATARPLSIRSEGGREYLMARQQTRRPF